MATAPLDARSAAALERRSLYDDIGRTVVIYPAAGEDTAEFFAEICAYFDDKQRIEQDAEGNAYVMSPTGNESSHRSISLSAQLHVWAEQDGRGLAFDSNTLFQLPDGSKRGPDAAWVSNQKLSTITEQQWRTFAPNVPEFVVELQSPSDQPLRLAAKMSDWIRNGVELAWSIHPEKKVVSIYRKDAEAVQLIDAEEIAGEGAVAGFTLDLRPIWKTRFTS